MSPPGGENKIMHANLRIGDTTRVGVLPSLPRTPRFQGFALSLIASSDAEAERLFGGLADGGAVQMLLAKAFCLALRHGCRSFRRVVDGLCGALIRLLLSWRFSPEGRGRVEP